MREGADNRLIIEGDFYLEIKMFNFGLLALFLKYLVIGLYHGVEKQIINSLILALDNLKYLHLTVL